VHIPGGFELSTITQVESAVHHHTTRTTAGAFRFLWTRPGHVYQPRRVPWPPYIQSDLRVTRPVTSMSAGESNPSSIFISLTAITLSNYAVTITQIPATFDMNAPSMESAIQTACSSPA